MDRRSYKNRETVLLKDNLTSLKYLEVAYCQVVQAIHSGSLQHSSSAVSRTVSVSAAVQIFVWTGTEISCSDICTKLKVATGNIGFLTKKNLNFLVRRYKSHGTGTFKPKINENPIKIIIFL